MRPFLAIILILVALALGAGAFYVFSMRGTSTTTEPPAPITPSTTSGPLTSKETGIQQIKSAHFEDSSPAHNEVFATAPLNVTINFNFDLATNSTITIEKDGVDYGDGSTVVDANKLTLRRKMKAAPDGIYVVKYKACWPDGSCHDGQHAFTIDSSQLTKYTDMTGQSTVAVDMKNIAFSIPYLVVSKGTKVTWTNSDAVTHYVNADSHPQHTFVLALNSQALEMNGTFSYTFNDPGEYPYHCSAHAGEMMARIVVK